MKILRFLFLNKIKPENDAETVSGLRQEFWNKNIDEISLHPIISTYTKPRSPIWKTNTEEKMFGMSNYVIYIRKLFEHYNVLHDV